MSWNLDDVLIDIKCPRCGYEQDVELIDAKLQRRIFCPACKSTIQLVDSDASVHTSLRQVDDAMKSLEKTLRGFGG